MEALLDLTKKEPREFSTEASRNWAADPVVGKDKGRTLWNQGLYTVPRIVLFDANADFHVEKTRREEPEKILARLAFRGKNVNKRGDFVCPSREVAGCERIRARPLGPMA